MKTTLKGALAAAALLVALPAGASATAITDNPGTGGVLINGENLVTGVAGTQAPGAISARFADSAIPLFYFSPNGVSPGASARLSIHLASGVSPLAETTAPALTGTGSLSDPWYVTSAFTAGPLAITQRVRHIDGSRALRVKWTIKNTAGTATTFKAFWSTDLYVSGNDAGKGAVDAGPPRTLAGIAQDGPGGTDGTKVKFTEITPWSHYYEGSYFTATMPQGTAPYDYDDTTNPNVIDNGVGVEWAANATNGLAAGATTTIELGLFAVEPGGSPVPTDAPDITSAPTGTVTTDGASIAFAAHAGDTATTSFECRVDDDPFDICVSPLALTDLDNGAHTVQVRGVSDDGEGGPAASTTWTTDVPEVVDPGTPHPSKATVRIASTLRQSSFILDVPCTVDLGAIYVCKVDLLGKGEVLLGTGRVQPSGSVRSATVKLALTAEGRRQLAAKGKVGVNVRVRVKPVGFATVAGHAEATILR